MSLEIKEVYVNIKKALSVWMKEAQIFLDFGIR